MGKRSTNTTNRVKYVNPADHVRKQARKKELQKNKKQRQMVRTAALKRTDPNQIINDLESIDEMEYNVYTPPPLCENVLREKRKKLKETWERVVMLYNKENRDRYYELKKLEREYESRRTAQVKYYESIQCTQKVQPDEIPLPETPYEPLVLTDQILLRNGPQLPHVEPEIPKSVPNKSVVCQSTKLKPPGLPPGLPPDLSSDDDDDENAEKACTRGIKRKSRIDQAGFDTGEYDDVDKAEDESEFCDEETVTSAIRRRKLLRTIHGDEKSGHDEAVKSFTEAINIPVHGVPLPAGPALGLPQCPPPVSDSLMFRPPPLTPGLPLLQGFLQPGMLPPPPPPPPPGVPLRVSALRIRLPAGPPPGSPPTHLIGRPVGPPATFTMPPPRLPVVTSGAEAAECSVSATAGLSVLSAPSQSIEEAPCSSVIEAKPQVRILSAEVTKFMPTSLRIKRAGKHKKRASQGGSALEKSKDVGLLATPVPNPSVSVLTKDDAYLQFLKEMEQFL